jgi:hypothetical protein
MRIANLHTGDVYRLKAVENAGAFAQVGEGGDVGFFRAWSLTDVLTAHMVLRVVVNEPDFRRHWKKEGRLPIHRSLGELANYGDSDLGSDAKYSVRIDNIDARVVVDDATFASLERLAVWETTHILQRLETA